CRLYTTRTRSHDTLAASPARPPLSTRRSSDLSVAPRSTAVRSDSPPDRGWVSGGGKGPAPGTPGLRPGSVAPLTPGASPGFQGRSEEHTAELQSPQHLVRRLVLETTNSAAVC